MKKVKILMAIGLAVFLVSCGTASNKSTNKELNKDKQNSKEVVSTEDNNSKDSSKDINTNEGNNISNESIDDNSEKSEDTSDNTQIDTSENTNNNEEIVSSDEHVSNTEEVNNDEVISSAEDTSNDEVISTVESKKEEYLKKCDDLQAYLDSTLAEKRAGTTFDMREAAGTEIRNWDNLLNEVYGVLIEQLPDDEMDALREEENNWINERDVKAQEAADKYKGGTMEPLEFESTIASETKERCYELINNYMK